MRGAVLDEDGAVHGGATCEKADGEGECLADSCLSKLEPAWRLQDTSTSYKYVAGTHLSIIILKSRMHSSLGCQGPIP